MKFFAILLVSSVVCTAANATVAYTQTTIIPNGLIDFGSANSTPFFNLPIFNLPTSNLTGVLVEIKGSIYGDIRSFTGPEYTAFTPIALEVSVGASVPGFPLGLHQQELLSFVSSTANDLSFSMSFDLTYTTTSFLSDFTSTGTNSFELFGGAGFNPHQQVGIIGGGDLGEFGSFIGTVSETFLVPEPSSIFGFAMGLMGFIASTKSKRYRSYSCPPVASGL